MRSLGCEFLSCVLMTGVSVLAQTVLLRVTYLNTSSFAFYLLPFGLRTLWRRSRESKNGYKAPRCVKPHCLGQSQRGIEHVLLCMVRLREDEYQPLVEDGYVSQDLEDNVCVLHLQTCIAF